MANNKAIGAEVEKYLTKKIQQLETGLITAFDNVGLKAVTHARKNVAFKAANAKPQKPEYTVRTGNLVSSTGYTLIKDGQVVKASNFEAVRGSKGNGAEGSATGKAFAAQKATESPASGIRLVVVAGMPYAKYVQAKGYDVLDSAQLLAENEAKKKIDDVIKRLT